MMRCSKIKKDDRAVIAMTDKSAAAVTPEAVIRKRRNQLNNKQGWIDLIVRVTVAVSAAWLFMSFVFLVCRANGMSMFPAIKDGDLIISYRLQKEYEKNDVVVFERDGKKQIGRVLAFEGDTVSISESGILSVNGTPQQGKIMYPTYPKKRLTYPYIVPADSCFILCDYRTRCEDSRDFGAVCMDDVKSKVITILRRQDL